jgi:hypothetical protein
LKTGEVKIFKPFYCPIPKLTVGIPLIFLVYLSYMSDTLKRFVFFACFILYTVSCKAQSFYITQPIDDPLSNKGYKQNLDSNCVFTDEYYCPPTNNIGQWFENWYSDIAVDKNSIWYVSCWSSLYKRNLADSACQYVGSFPAGSINALTADSAGTIYAAGHVNYVGVLYKYDSTGFTLLGTFPSGFVSAGDLFFYEHRLFLTGTSAPGTMKYLIEVSLPNPALSCYYMSLNNYDAFAAFSIREQEGSRAFIVANGGTYSTLMELDIPNQQILPPLCIYPFPVWGAGANYNRSAAITSCTPNPLNVAQPLIPKMQITNPVEGRLFIHTDLNPVDLLSANIFDLSGRKMLSFMPSQFPENLDVSNLPGGLYLFRIITKSGIRVNEKFLKR